MSMILDAGVVLDSICVEYCYDQEEYVWPDVKEDKSRRMFHDRIPEEHFAVCRDLFAGFTGICNVNYKARSDTGGIAIFEVNPRIGGDLAEDVPRGRARAFFEQLDRSAAAEPEATERETG